jgi:hypothetical protein
MTQKRAGWIIGLLLFLLVVCVLGLYFGPQTLTYFKLRDDLKARSLSSRGPSQLIDLKASECGGTTLAYYGYKFEVPWQGIAKERNPVDWVEIDFKDGQVVHFVDPDFVSAQQWNYQEFESTISVMPSQLSPFSSHHVFRRTLALLNAKGALFEHSPIAPDIFAFGHANYRGFEFSGLSQGWQWVELTLFDNAENRFQITASVSPSSGAKLTQSQINCIIQSFAPVTP